jgi:hypothetical protein
MILNDLLSTGLLHFVRNDTCMLSTLFTKIYVVTIFLNINPSIQGYFLRLVSVSYS